MISECRWSKLVVVGVLVWTLASHRALAQEPEQPADPFGADAKPAAAPAAKPAAPKAEPEKPETDPNVLTIRAMNPGTPMELMSAIEKLMNLGRPDEAKKYLKTLTDAKVDEVTLWSFQRKFGSAIFFRMMLDKGMEPEGRPFAQSVLNAAHKMVRDPRRLDALIKQLSSQSPETRHAALVDLKDGGEDAAIALLGVLADPGRAAEHPAARLALAELGKPAEGPMLAAMDSNNDALRRQVLEVMGLLRSHTAIPYLLRPALSDANSPMHPFAKSLLVELGGGVPTRAAAERYLYRKALSFFNGELPSKPDHEDLVTIWRWDPQAKRPVVERQLGTVASLQMSLRFSGELVQLAPDNREYRTLYLTGILEAAKILGGWERPLNPSDAVYVLAANAGPGALEEVIRFALSRGRHGAAIGALEVIGATGNIDVLTNASGRPRPVSEALQNEDRRVRFAALQAIRQIDPHESFPGASFVSETIGYFARASGTRRALIAHPRLEQSQSLVGLFRDMGIEADAATLGSTAFQLALQNPDYEFVCLSDAVDHPNVRELLQQFRRESRTANLPIAVLAREDNFAQFTRLTESDPLAGTFARPYDAAGVSFLVGRLMERVGDDFVSGEERLRQAEAALDYMIAMAEKPAVYGFMDLVSQQLALEHALLVPQLSAKAARALGLLATSEAQRSLVMVASQNERGLAQRQAAAAAFDVAVKRRGLLLTRPEILAQFDRYNASATLDVETQNVLGALLDSIEFPSKKVSQKNP